MTWVKGRSSGQLFPNAPADTIFALGAGSRILAIIPSKEMVLVRLGSFPIISNFNNS